MASPEALMESTNMCIYLHHQHGQQSTPRAQPSSNSYPDSALQLPEAALRRLGDARTGLVNVHFNDHNSGL